MNDADPPNGFSHFSLLFSHIVFKTAVVFVYKDCSKHRKKIVSTVFCFVFLKTFSVFFPV